LEHFRCHATFLRVWVMFLRNLFGPSGWELFSNQNYHKNSHQGVITLVILVRKLYTVTLTTGVTFTLGH
jgi:hypothetical protein